MPTRGMHWRASLSTSSPQWTAVCSIRIFIRQIVIQSCFSKVKNYLKNTLSLQIEEYNAGYFLTDPAFLLEITSYPEIFLMSMQSFLLTKKCNLSRYIVRELRPFSWSFSPVVPADHPPIGLQPPLPNHAPPVERCWSD